jgi:hypothetical protein
MATTKNHSGAIAKKVYVSICEKVAVYFCFSVEKLQKKYHNLKYIKGKSYR